MRDQQHFDPKGVSALYGVTLATVLHWIRTGELAAVNVSRSAASKKPRWRISAAALEAFEARRQPGPPPTRTARRPKAASNVVKFY